MQHTSNPSHRAWWPITLGLLVGSLAGVFMTLYFADQVIRQGRSFGAWLAVALFGICAACEIRRLFIWISTGKTSLPQPRAGDALRILFIGLAGACLWLAHDTTFAVAFGLYSLLGAGVTYWLSRATDTGLPTDAARERRNEQ